MKNLVLLAALAASFLTSACTYVTEDTVHTRPAAATVIQRY